LRRATTATRINPGREDPDTRDRETENPTMIREMVFIDEEKCDGCGQCVPACQEGAIQIINGKARLVADNLCDGLGACLGHCPRDAIRIERRDADAYDEAAVARHLGARTQSEPDPVTPPAPPPAPMHGGCPSAKFIQLGEPAPSPAGSASTQPAAPTALRQWPVQLRLLPPQAPMLRGADLLLSADCVPYAMPDFHARLLDGRAVAVACPKLDDPTGYVEKLADMIRLNDFRRITVARMEVPCCAGILMMVLEACKRSGVSVPVHDVVVSTRGEVLAERTLTDELAA
jgi:ferredoxin